MRAEADIAQAAALFADTSRARVLMALADGRALPATRQAGVSPQAMSSHLSKLMAAGLVTAERSGRHRYYALTGAHVGDVLEALTLVARPRPITSLRQGTRAQRLWAARSCYDHLAGQLGVRSPGPSSSGRCWCRPTERATLPGARATRCRLHFPGIPIVSATARPQSSRGWASIRSG